MCLECVFRMCVLSVWCFECVVFECSQRCVTSMSKSVGVSPYLIPQTVFEITAEQLQHSSQRTQMMHGQGFKFGQIFQYGSKCFFQRIVRQDFVLSGTNQSRKGLFGNVVNVCVCGRQ